MDPYEVTASQENEVWNWYLQVETELKDNLSKLTPQELNHLRDYYSEAGLLTAQRKSFFRRHYSFPFAHVIETACKGSLKGARVLDLGGGSGTQAIYFARLGAEVHVVDLDDVALAALEKRRRYYEEVFGQPLNIHTHCVNIFDYLKDDGPKFDMIYSLFAFNMVQPTQKLVPLLSHALVPGGQLIVQDGNREHVLFRHLRKRPSLSPPELARTLKADGFQTAKFLSCIALPPVAWSILPERVSTFLDKAFLKMPNFSVSYLLVARKGAK